MSKSEIEALASVHLGKAGDGSVVKPYVTPDSVDANLLVGVPRILNRTDYDIRDEALPFVGFDTWNCYEFSTLTDNGFPVTGLLRIIYESDSANIVESKSLKLYLNSYNMANCGKTVAEVVANIRRDIRMDLADTVQGDVQVGFIQGKDDVVEPFRGFFRTLEDDVNVTNISFDHFNESPDILVVTESSVIESRDWHSSVLRSNCRVTNQPDWGDIYIHIKGQLLVTPESMLQYIVSMRKENHFHEEIAECVYKRLWDLLEPEELMVTCLYTRRGGIDINPCRASSVAVLNSLLHGLDDEYVANVKTLRQ